MDTRLAEVSHAVMHQPERLPADKFIVLANAVVVSGTDGTYLPEPEFIQEGVAVDAYLAHEQLVCLAGG